MARLLVLFFTLGLTACADWPNVDAPPTGVTGDWPELLPIAALPIAPGTAEEEAANDDLLNRADTLRARAAILRRPVPDSDAFERLRSTLAR